MSQLLNNTARHTENEWIIALSQIYLVSEFRLDESINAYVGTCYIGGFGIATIAIKTTFVEIYNVGNFWQGLSTNIFLNAEMGTTFDTIFSNVVGFGMTPEFIVVKSQRINNGNRFIQAWVLWQLY